ADRSRQHVRDSVATAPDTGLDALLCRRDETFSALAANKRVRRSCQSIRRQSLPIDNPMNAINHNRPSEPQHRESPRKELAGKQTATAWRHARPEAPQRLRRPAAD